MNFAVLTVPDFSLHALRRGEPALAGKPLALIAGEGRKAVLCQVSAGAAGLEPGLAAPLAMARCPGVILRTRDARADIEAHRLLVAAAFTLSPRVEATAHDACTVDLQGADDARTEAAMRLRCAELAGAGKPARAGGGATPLLASYAARCAAPVLVVRDPAEFLRGLPLAFAEPTGVQGEILRGWGIHTLGDLSRLPKGEIGRRLGADGAALWERAAGDATRVLRLTEPVRSFVADWNYEPPIDTLEPLLFKLRRYAERVSFELRAAGLVAEALTLTLFLEDDTDYRREFRLAEPGTDVDAWLRIFLSHLESLKLGANLTAVGLAASPARPVVKQDGLFDTGLRDPHAFWENLTRVAAVLGEGRVGTPVPSETWRPDSFTLEKPAESVPAAGPEPVHPPRGGVLRRYRPSRPIRVEREGGRPSALSGAVAGSVRAAAGPWRASGGWWRPGGWEAETWRVELADGGVYQLARTAEGWVVEGVID